MTRAYRFLTTSVNSSSMAMAESPEKAPVESDFRLILAASLCALVCVVGYLALVTCTWLKRRSMTNQSQVKPPANKGLEKEYVEALPKFAYDLSKEYNERKLSSSECVICLVEYANGDEIRVLPQCGHEFHIGCIDKWLGSHSSCPSCRHTVVIGICKTCGEFPTITTGNNLLVAEHESRQPNDGSCSVIRVEGSL